MRCIGRATTRALLLISVSFSAPQCAGADEEGKLAVESVEPEAVSRPADVVSEPSPTPPASTPDDPTPTVTPTPISLEEFKNRLSQWVFVDFLQIADFKEATLNDLSTGESWRVEEGDVLGDLRVISITAGGMKVNIGGREGEILPVQKTGYQVILEDDFGPHAWARDAGAPVVVGDRAFRGKACFRPGGNNRLNISPKKNWRIGDRPGTYKRLNVAIMPLHARADILIQVRGDKHSWTRWGFDAEKTYRGGYPWPVVGTSTGLQPNRWHYFSIHLLDDLGFPAGDRILEIAFSCKGKDVLFDSVSLSRQIPPGARPVKSPR